MTADDKTAVRNPAGTGSADSLSDLKQLGKYQIDKKIGAGGMGAVFLARDTELKRVVALKVLPRDKAENPILVRRFRAEAQAAAQLRHPNIVAVYDSGEADGYLYIAMEYVEGRDLFEMVSRRGIVPARRSIEVIKQVAAALQHAFEQNIVHRDIKPSNLLIRRDGTVKLTDLGLARSIDDTLETNITRAGTTVGTVDYMAPEQARNSKLADIRSDLYSLGCTWYQMLTGSPPYPEGSVTNKLQAHAIKPIPDPRDKNPQVPEGLTAVLRRLMAKKPEDRYQTPAEFLDDLAHSALTEAAISREIFADSDSEISTNIAKFEDEAYSDDGYFELDDVREVSETPVEVPIPPQLKSPIRKKTPSPTTNAPEETQPVYYKTKPRPPSTPTEDKAPESEPQTQRNKPRPATDDPSDSQPVQYKTRPRPAKNDSKESEPAQDSRHTSRIEEEEQAADPVARKSKMRPDKPETAEPTPTSKSKPSSAKHVDQKPTKPKEPGQKTLPPKRQPVENADESKPLLNKDLLRNLTAIAALVLLIVGVGWMISQYGANVDVDKTPFGPPPDNTSTQPASSAPKVTTNQGDPDSAESPAVTVANNTPGTARPDVPASTFDADKIPDWALKSAEIASLPTLTVSAAAKSATNFSSLEEALQAVTSTGAVIKLQGVGPFPLPLVELAQRKRIVITGASPQDRPVIALKPAEGQATAGLKISDTILDLRGVHFTMDRQVVTGPVKAVEVIDGQLFAQECSFTSSNVSSEPAVAMLMSSINDAMNVPRMEPNLLVDRVWVRGDGLTGLSVRRANVDAVVRDSLMVTGSAATIDMAGHVSAGVAEVALNKPRRILRVQRSTLCAMNKVFDLAADESGKPPQTAIALRDAICAAEGIVQNSTIVFAGRWPQVRSAEGWLTKLTWTSNNTLYLGFEQLIDLGSSFKVSDATTWQRVWGSKTDPRQFQKLSFPESASDDLNTALPQEFDSSGLSYREVKASDGGMPGCTIGKLPIPDAVSQQRAVAFTSRPTLPNAAIKPPDPVQVRKIDLKKDDLGLILNKGDWPSGTMFEASGSGLIYMTPAKIEGKSLRIVIKQTDGASLKIMPQQAKGGETTKTVSPALISINRGTMELTNAVLEGSSNTKAGTPEWLIHAVDATVILNGCRLLGPEAEGTKQLGLVNWSTKAPAQSAGDSPALVIRDSYLAGPGCGIRAECGQGSMIVRNSVLAVRGDGIDLRPARSGTALHSCLDAENVTISATGAAIRFQAAPGTDPVSSPIRLFLEKCVVGPPLAFKANEASNSVMLLCVGPVIEQHQVEWWGGSNGVSKRVAHLIKRDGDSDIPSDEKTGLTAWRKLWEKGSSVRLLTGDKGIYLNGELPVKWRDLKPASFELHKNSQGATWAEGGRPIGANAIAVESSSTPKKGADSPTVKPTTPNISTKKNVGF